MEINKIAYEYGFDLARVVPAEPLTVWREKLSLLPQKPKEALGLVDDSRLYGTSVLLLGRKYLPFEMPSNVSSYYICSNQGYHKAKQLTEELVGKGFEARMVSRLPVRAIALRNGIGTTGLNALLSIDGFGTRMAFYTVALNAAPDTRFPETSEKCSNCMECAKACPVGAISEKGLDSSRCIREYMNGDTMPDDAKEAMTTLLGCELCQNACPLNRKLGTAVESARIKEAFDLERILSGNEAEAGLLAGKNLISKRLKMQAIILAANKNRKDLLPLIKKAAESNRAAVRDAAAWAITKLEGRKT